MSVNEQLIIRRIRKWIASDIPELQSSNRETPLLTPLEHYEDTHRTGSTIVGYTRESAGPHYSTKRHAISHLVASALRFIEADPSNPVIVRALENTYTFMADEPREPEKSTRETFTRLLEHDFLNSTPSSAVSFVRALAKLAQANRMLHADTFVGKPKKEGTGPASYARTLLQGSRFVLAGDKGVGKTTLLNYAFSVLNPVLHSERVIWIRIDLTKDLIVPRDNILPLLTLLHAQFCEVLFRYYDADSRFLDRQRLVDPNSEAPHWTEKEKYRLVFDLSTGNEKLYEFCTRRNVHISRTDFDSELVSIANAARLRLPAPQPPESYLFQAIWDYLTIEQGVGFVFVIDGLDKLGLTEREQEIYEQRVKEIQRVISIESAMPAVYLLVMRNETFMDEFWVRLYGRDFRTLSVGQVDIRRVFSKKMARLDDPNWVESHLRDYPTLQKDVSSVPEARIVGNAFMRWVSAGLDITLGGSIGEMQGKQDERRTTFAPEIGFRMLDELFGSNHRLLYEALSSIADFYMGHVGERFDAALDSDYLASFHDNFATIHTENTDREAARAHYLLLEALMLRRTDRPFCFDRYRYGGRRTYGWGQGLALVQDRGQEYVPNLFSYPYSGGSSRMCCPLMSIRMLQSFLDKRVSDRLALVSWLEERFAYPAELTNLRISQLTEAGAFAIPTSSVVYNADDLKITVRGRSLLFRLPFALEYVALALQTVPLPSRLVERGLFPVAPYGETRYVVDNKMVSVINLIRVLRWCEKQEREHFLLSFVIPSNEYTRDQRFESALGQSFEIVDKMEDVVLKSLERIVISAYRSNERALIGLLEDRFLKDPVRYFGFVASFPD